MSLSQVIIWWCVLLVGMLGSALCSGLEVGLYSVNRVLVRVHASGGAHRKRAKVLAAQIDHPTNALTALLVWNNIFNYAGTLAITTLVATLGLGDLEMILIQVVVLTPVLLIFAESTPKEVFRANADVVMERFARPIQFFRISLTWIPIVPLLLLLANLGSRLIGAESFGALASGRERMAELLKFGSTQMSEAQVSLIDRALELEHASVRSEMIPLKNAIVVRAGWSIARARAFVRNYSYTRYPVISAKGQVVGVLSGLDLYIAPGADSASKVGELARDPIRIDGAMSVSQALATLSRSSGRMGIVMHAGREIGLITRKDLIEPLVGELEDW